MAGKHCKVTLGRVGEREEGMKRRVYGVERKPISINLYYTLPEVRERKRARMPAQYVQTALQG